MAFKINSVHCAFKRTTIRSSNVWPPILSISLSPPPMRRASPPVAVIFVNFARIFAFQAFKIPTGSMEDNLKVGDHIIVNKFIYGPGTDRSAGCCRCARSGAATSSSSAIRSSPRPTS